MRNFKVTMAYDGTAYHGFQRQSNALAVQQVVEEAIEKLIGEKAAIYGCSRTDTGVHARQFVFNFHTESTINERGIVYGLNSLLPDDIAILSCEQAHEDFHARYHCKGKEYEYLIHNSSIKDPFYATSAYRYWYKLDAERMNEAAQSFVGEHDFKAMCAAACDKENTVRMIHSFTVQRNGDMVSFKVSGNGFLYNMVRIMVGTLIAYSEGKTDDIESVLSSRDRTLAGKTVPPHGLYLNKVFY